MYQLNETEVWREHRRELLRKAESGRLARRLRTRRPDRVARFRSAFLGRIFEALVRPLADGWGRV
jgi:hypothetical protein